MKSGTKEKTCTGSTSDKDCGEITQEYSAPTASSSPSQPSHNHCAEHPRVSNYYQNEIYLCKILIHNKLL